MTRSLAALIMLVLAFPFPVLCAGNTLPAFPGAEGWGADTPGGRGGQVIRVTNLDADGPGSLQWAVSREGPRVVVFDVSGVIESDVTIGHGRLTILGQTAPGAGITIHGKLGTASGDERLEDIVVRFLRVRARPARDGDGSDFDTVQFNRVRHCVLDHLSVSWSTDENIGMFQAEECTVQWCAIEESDVVGHYKGRHNYGMLNGPGGGRVSVHHNLFAHNGRRNPALANGPSDVRNNVVYNFRDGFLHDNPPNRLGFNIVGNYYLRGPDEDNIYPFCFRDWVPYYLRDNYVDGVGVVDNPWEMQREFRAFAVYMHHGRRAEEPFDVPEVTTQPCERAFELVLARAGCFPRDAVSRRTVSEVRTRTGSWGRHEPADLMQGLEPGSPPQDSDSDGMPDAWERANGLDPADGADHATVMQSGYTAIEEYANGLAETLVSGADL